MARMKNKHDTGQALPILAHMLARAVYDPCKRQQLVISTRSSLARGAERVSLTPHGTRRGLACHERARCPVGLRR
jgi:hypothetical protein